MTLDPLQIALGRKFFERDADQVAKELIGCYLVRKRDGKMLGSRIAETEAYVGPQDLACHASRGRTLRTEVMFGPAGTLYIYLVYGLYWMINVVTDPVGFPAAVLIRSTDTIKGPGRLSQSAWRVGRLLRVAQCFSPPAAIKPPTCRQN
jgi:DNA-3-methyladenine glycosylase